MKELHFKNARLACCYFFALPGICYALVTSRMPVIKLGASVDDAQIGMALLCLGIASLGSLYCAGRMIGRHGSRRIMLTSSIIVGSGCVSCAVASSPVLLYVACALFGAGMGLIDVAVNAHGVELEHLTKSVAWPFYMAHIAWAQSLAQFPALFSPPCKSLLLSISL